MIADLKRCARCGKILHVSKFNKNASMPDGLQMHCKTCERVAKQESAAKTKKRKALRKLAEAVVENRAVTDVNSLAAQILKVY